MSRAIAAGAMVGAAVCGGSAFLAPTQGAPQVSAAVAGVAAPRAAAAAPGAGWSAAAMGAVGAVGAAAAAKGRKQVKVEAGVSSTSETSMPIGKGGFIGASAEGLTVLSMCPKTGRAQAQKVCAGVAMALESRLCACLFWRSVGGALGRRSRHSGGATCLTLLV